MIFNTGIFLMFFLITFSVYWISNRFLGIRVRNAVLLLASYVFYGYWDWRFLVLIVFSSVVDFSIGKALMKSSEGTVRKRWMLTSVILNLGLLGVFKYANFFAGGFQQLLESIGLTVSYTTLNIVLPVGISFYTFQTMSYVIDVYRREVDAETDPLNFLTFVAFFPQLVAGPIERSAHMLPQFRKALTLRPEHIRMGFTFIAWGLFKKVVLAD
ncbi:MAG: MBOAT family protein, partial [Flavobacteriales bacterium]|nr:MBOAT family protein [Flavobacteriales bacterium]